MRKDEHDVHWQSLGKGDLGKEPKQNKAIGVLAGFLPHSVQTRTDILSAGGQGPYAGDVCLASLNRIRMWKLTLIDNRNTQTTNHEYTYGDNTKCFEIGLSQKKKKKFRKPGIVRKGNWEFPTTEETLQSKCRQTNGPPAGALVQVNATRYSREQVLVYHLAA